MLTKMKIGKRLILVLCLFATASFAQPAAKAQATSNSWLGSFSSLFTYPLAAPLAMTDLYGETLSLQDYRGRVVVVSFIDKKSQKEAIEWVESLPADYLGDSKLVFVNVIFPGGISFLVPRPKVVQRLRSDIESVRQSMRLSLPTGDRAKLEKTTIRWAADWKRHHSTRWGVIRHRVNVFIVDGQGRLRDTLRGMSDSTTKRLSLLLPRLLEEIKGSERDTQSADSAKTKAEKGKTTESKAGEK